MDYESPRGIDGERKVQCGDKERVNTVIFYPTQVSTVAS